MRRVLLPIVALSLVVAACSSGDDGGDVASLAASTDEQSVLPTSEDEIDREAALFAFTECLRDEGMEVEDPEIGSDGQIHLPRPDSLTEEDREVFRIARESCSEHLDGVTLGFADRDTTEFQDLALEYAACMRDNGFDMPDPDLTGFQPGSGGGSGGGGGIFGGLEDRNDPTFIAADEICRPIFGDLAIGRGPGGGGGGGGG